MIKEIIKYISRALYRPLSILIIFILICYQYMTKETFIFNCTPYIIPIYLSATSILMFATKQKPDMNSMISVGLIVVEGILQSLLCYTLSNQLEITHLFLIIYSMVFILLLVVIYGNLEEFNEFSEQ